MKTLTVLLISAMIMLSGCAMVSMKNPKHSASAITIFKDIHLKVKADTNNITQIEYDSIVAGDQLGNAVKAATAVK